jgi:hypothetical protein
MTKTTFRVWAGCLLIPVVMALTGCGQETPKAGQPKTTPTDKGAVAAKKAADHSHWWCAEHGIPEEECSMCSAKVAKTCKANGDWCEKHDRAKSQCFVCDPSLKEKFAAKYRAKYGKEPPLIEDEKDGK